MKWLKYVMLLAAVSLAAITKITLPTDFNTVANGTRANLSSNFSEIDTRSDAAFDSVDEVRGRMTGYTGDFTITSLDHLRLRLDSDGSILGRFFISNGSTGDSLWRISEDSTWRAFGAGTGTKITLSDSILAATARISGNGIFDGPLGVTGASTLAALSATTGTFSGTLTANAAFNIGASGSATLGYMVASRIPYTGASSDLTSTSNLTYTPGTTTFATANAVLSGTLTLSGMSVGRLVTTTTGGTFTTDNLYWDATNDRLGIGSAASSPSAVGAFYGGTGASAGIILGTNLTDATNKEGRLKASHYTNAEEPVTIAWLASTSSASTLNIGGNSSAENATTAIDFYTASNNTTVSGTRRGGFNSSGAFDIVGLTASLPVFTNGSSQLTTNAITGTGNVVMSTSPTLVTPTLGVASATTMTLGGGEAFTYGDTSFTVTLTGVSGSVTGTATASKVGKIITMRLPTLSGTSNATTATITGIPTGWRPDAQVFVPAAIQDNSTYYNVDFRPAAIYGILLETGGTATLALNGNASGFTSSGTKGCYTSVATFLAP